MRDHAEPTLDDLARTIAVARLLFGREMNIQAPPNLVPDQDGRANGGTPQSLHALIRAGINDWGGISPLTIDYINPERPWPHIEWLRQQMQAVGFELKERLAIYPEFVGKPDFLTPSLITRVQSKVDARGYPC
jgi:FO synthase